jgi:N-acetylglucosaminyl-diphospho-decaprenol L-rhamnosyltransferase
MYGEDTDWAFRIKAAGWRIMYVPTATVRHLKRSSSRKYRALTIGYFYDAMRLFYDEHYKPMYPGPITLAIHLAIAARRRLELTANRLQTLRAGTR